MAKRKRKQPAQRRGKFKPMARMGLQLSELLEERRATPHGEYERFMKRSAGSRFEAFVAKDNSVAEIDVYDVIGTFETNASTFKRMLDEITAPQIVVNINSPGGSVFDAFAMFADLRSHSAKVHVRISGLAASAASVLAMAGDTIEIAENGFMMIHNAWVLALGDKREMTKTANALAQVDTRIAKAYANRTGADLDDITAMMDEETWMDSEDALERGFVNRITDSVPVENLVQDVSNFGKAPSAVRMPKLEPAEIRQAPAPKPEPVDDGAHVAAAIRACAATLRGC